MRLLGAWGPQRVQYTMPSASRTTKKTHVGTRSATSSHRSSLRLRPAGLASPRAVGPAVSVAEGIGVSLGSEAPSLGTCGVWEEVCVGLEGAFWLVGL